MNEYWNVLGIEETRDVRRIKHAFAMSDTII